MPIQQIAIAFITLVLCCALSEAQTIVYVSPGGCDEQAGTRDMPFQTVQCAVGSGAQTIRLLEGIHYQERHWIVSKGSILFEAVGDAVISGGRRLTGWTQTPDGWRLVLPEVREGKWFFRQLFDHTAGKRLPRARIPNDGWLRGEKGSHVDFPVIRTETRDVAGEGRKTKLDLFTTLRFKEDDAGFMADWPDVQQAELLMLASWDTSWHSLRDINLDTRDIRFFTPSRYPVDHWHYSTNKTGAPYRIENVRAAVDAPGEWYLNKTTGELLLKGSLGFDPNQREIIAPVHERILDVRGSDVTFRGLSFAHNVYPMGVYDQHGKDWPERMRKIDPTFPVSFPPGYSDSQAAPRAGEAVLVERCRDVLFENCRFVHAGNWAVGIGRDAHRITISRGRFNDLGAGAVQIDPAGSTSVEEVPSENKVVDCVITNGCRIHPAAVAIRIAGSRDNTIAHNEIAHFGYSGISVGWNWSRTPNHCSGNQIINNHIHHVTGMISDGSGLYSLGVLTGTVFRGNYIHDILRAETAVGAGNTGMLIDQYSLGIHFDQNVIRRVQTYRPEDNRPNHAYRLYRNEPSDHTWGDNDFEYDDSPVRLTETVKRAGPRKE